MADPDSHDPNGPGSQLVQLDAHELALAGERGLDRNKRARRLGARQHHGHAADWRASVRDHVLGVAGEMAVAGSLGVEWAERGITRAPDVGRYHVRTGRRPEWSLIVHPSERGPFVFVTVAYRRVEHGFRIVGYAELADEPDAAFWRDPAGGRPAYFIPQRCLIPWSDRPSS